jgi:hypothetical protein
MLAVSDDLADACPSLLPATPPSLPPAISSVPQICVSFSESNRWYEGRTRISERRKGRVGAAPCPGGSTYRTTAGVCRSGGYMSVIYSPAITRNDFESFRRLINKDFPYTYDEWLDLAREKDDKFVEARNTIEFVKIEPDEFSRFLWSTEASPDLQSLWQFAHEKCRGRKY